MAALRRCAGALLLAACSSSTGPNAHGITNIVLTPDTLTVAVGDSANIQGQAVNAGGAPIPGIQLFWSSSDPSIATVNQQGVVKAVGVGSANIDASYSGVSPKQPARVVVVGTPVASIAIAPKTVTLRIGSALQFTDTTKDAAGNLLTGRTVVWSSSDTTIASVDQAGLVIAKKGGSVTITVASGAVSATSAVTVTAVPVSKIVITPTNPSVTVGQTTQLVATPEDSIGDPLTGRVITWGSSDSTTATITPNGIATGKKAGSVVISATSEGVSATTTLTVQAVPINAVSISPQSSNLLVGQTVTLTAVVTDNSGSPIPGATVTFTSNATKVATVTSTGPLTATVTAVAAGTAQVMGTSGGKSGTAAINVSPVPVGSVTIAPTTASVTLGGTVQLTATVKDTAGNVLTGRTVTWTSLTKGVATVSGTGLLTAVGVGSSVITASSGGQTGVATVTVNQVPIASVTISPKGDTINVGAQKQLSVTVKDSVGHTVKNPTVTWSSSNSKIATVSSSGLVQGVAAGTALIIAQSGSIADTNTTLVIQAPVASVSVAIGAGTISVGQTTVVTATPKDASGNVLFGRALTWSASANGTASVSPGGVDPSSQLDTATVTGIAAGGPVTITATSSNNASGHTTVSVASAINHIVLTPNQFTVNTGATQAVTAQAFDVNNHPLSGVTFTWSTKSGGTISSVNQSGGVSGVAAGSDSVYASAQGATGGAAVTVKAAGPPGPAPVDTVIVAPDSATITTDDGGKQVQLTDTLKDAKGNVVNGQTVSWSSSNTSIATVSNNGMVRAAGDTGYVTITVAAGSKQGTASVHAVTKKQQ